MILGVLVVLLAVQMVGEDEPVMPTARVAAPELRAGGRYAVPVDVTNEGDITATAVQVTAELTIGDDVFEAEQSIDFLAGDEVESVVFVFDDDPGSGDLVVRVASFREP